MRRIYKRALIAVALGVCVLLGLLAYAWGSTSNEYLFLPDPAHAVAPVIEVPGSAADPTTGGFYFVDVRFRPARTWEAWFGSDVHGAQLVPRAAVIGPGQSISGAQQEAASEMVSAQEEGAAVGERAAGRKVQIVGGGVRVESIEPTSPVAHSGLKPHDVIRSLGGKPVWARDDLAGLLRNATASTVLGLGVVRDGKQLTITTSPWMHGGTALIGIGVSQVSISVKLDPTPTYRTGDIGGPSAGLAFALDIYDGLTGRKLTRGTKIAVTGTISLNGSVGEIGGATQKAIGASQAGATVFLVPPGNLREAQKAAPKGLRVIAVTSFDDALRVLRALPADPSE